MRLNDFWLLRVCIIEYSTNTKTKLLSQCAVSLLLMASEAGMELTAAVILVGEYFIPLPLFFPGHCKETFTISVCERFECALLETINFDSTDVELFSQLAGVKHLELL